jgi:hypothetical protein
LSSGLGLVGALLYRPARVCVGGIGKGGGVSQSCCMLDMGDERLGSLHKVGLAVARVSHSLPECVGSWVWLFELLPSCMVDWFC